MSSVISYKIELLKKKNATDNSQWSFQFYLHSFATPSNQKRDKLCILLMENCQHLAQLWSQIQGWFSNKNAAV